MKVKISYTVELDDEAIDYLLRHTGERRQDMTPTQLRAYIRSAYRSVGDIGVDDRINEGREEAEAETNE